jgi:hypothetical protein
MNHMGLPNRRILNGAVLCLLLGATMSLGGCAGLGFIGRLMKDFTPVPAVYELKDQPTLVIVDDPNNSLGSLSLAVTVANLIAHHLQENEVISTPAITQAKLHQRAQSLDDDYQQTPIGQVGQMLGAAQVIHVRIESATLGREGTVFRPRCVVQVKLIDVVNRKRLFPPADTLVDSSMVQPDHRVTVNVEPQNIDRSNRGRSYEMLMAQALVQRVGLDVAQLFYEHKQTPVGHLIQNH